MIPFEEQLAMARELVRSGTVPGNGNAAQADQVQAAAREATRWMTTLVVAGAAGAAGGLVAGETVVTDEIRARALVAMVSCTTFCVHVRRSGPQPMVVKLALARFDCLARCAATYRRPPPESESTCDWCRRPSGLFWPNVLQPGPVIIVGDACRECASAITSGDPV